MNFCSEETVFLGIFSLVSRMKISKSQKKDTHLVFSSNRNPCNVHNGLKFMLAIINANIPKLHNSHLRCLTRKF